MPIDCQSCGACCAVPPALLTPEVRALYEGWEQVGSDFKVTPWRNGRCTALAGTIGERVVCTIYAMRPVRCRVYEPGGPLCQMARKLHGMEAA